MTETTQKTVYNVEYVAYQNGDIFSLVIKSTLKEGENPQRVIMQSYNYDIKNNAKVTLAQLLEKKQINVQTAQQVIRDTISKQAKDAQDLKELGYTVYTREVESDMYQIENANVYMMGQEGYLYIIYPYGNNHYTDAKDLVIL